MTTKKTKFPVIEQTVQVVVTKDQDLFGGLNMWNLSIRRPSDGFPMGVQWMDASNVERLLGISLPTYEVFRGKLKEIKD